MMTAKAGSRIETMDPVYPGLRFRPYHGPEDLPGMAAANQAMRDADGILDTTSAGDMAIQYANLTNSDLDRDVLIVERIDEPAGIVGYARVEWRDLTDGTRAFGSIILMDPRCGPPNWLGPWSPGPKRRSPTTRASSRIRTASQ